MNNVDLIIFDEEDVTVTLIESYLSSLNFKCNLQKYKEFNSAILENNDNFKIILVNVNADDNDIFNKILKISNLGKCKFIAMSYDCSANTQIKAFRAGAKDFLVKPLIKNNFISAVQSIYLKYTNKCGKNKQARVYTAISNREGEGKSVFLLNLAKEIADLTNEKVLLIDFNSANNNVPSMLNINIMHNTDYYINNLTQDNAQALLASVEKYKNSSLYIMANSFIKSKPFIMKMDTFENAFRILKKNYSYIFIDKTPDEDSLENKTIIDIVDEVFCIVLPHISSFDKIKNVLDTYYKNKNIKYILNQNITDDDYKIEKIQSNLGGEIFWKIPKNYTVLKSAANKNITIKENSKETDIANSFIELAKYIINRD